MDIAQTINQPQNLGGLPEPGIGSKIRRALVLSGGGALGAYQVGVWRWLEQVGWQPDMVCGSYVGAVNAALIAAGQSAATIEQFWESLSTRQIFSVPSSGRPKCRFPWLHGGIAGSTMFADISDLANLLAAAIDMNDLRESGVQLIVTAPNDRQAKPYYLSGGALGVEDIVSSCTVPGTSACSRVNQAYLCGNGLSLAPGLVPAVRAGAQENILVLPGPSAGSATEFPPSIQNALSWALDLASIGSAFAQMDAGSLYTGENTQSVCEGLLSVGQLRMGESTVHVVTPSEAVTLPSTLNFNLIQMRKRFEAGYQDSAKALSHLTFGACASVAAI